MMSVRNSWRNPFYKLSRFLGKSLVWLLFRWRVVGAEHIPVTGPLVLSCNHINNLDPISLGASTPRFVHFMAKQELFRWRPVGKLLSFYGAFAVKRGAGDRSAIRYALAVPEAGQCLVIFPEGHRSRTGALGKGQSGIAMIAKRAQCPIVPCVVIGPYRFRGRLTVRFGAPLLAQPDQSNDEILATLFARMQALLDEGHAM